ncbi:hypothetical protein M406DRAFT_69219 [Cryphonectria parasitica EP155]|uniref:Uncharacterized protein n=1 Tax=Cryphonectria parasitica (strain ATCC 38755 / EP155) TaxID=660469 RepID=A0A9P4Y4Z2_CRYP1|nr:uncharacterized protein M406DRAFT_69219 [Cryphonectria parasitica EP155]KAF3767049.1 hypothetical protein M406DRAFT_69219 [Cryphonectria parasitica EP155]
MFSTITMLASKARAACSNTITTTTNNNNKKTLGWTLYTDDRPPTPYPGRSASNTTDTSPRPDTTSLSTTQTSHPAYQARRPPSPYPGRGERPPSKSPFHRICKRLASRRKSETSTHHRPPISHHTPANQGLQLSRSDLHRPRHLVYADEDPDVPLLDLGEPLVRVPSNPFRVSPAQKTSFMLSAYTAGIVSSEPALVIGPDEKDEGEGEKEEEQRHEGWLRRRLRLRRLRSVVHHLYNLGRRIHDPWTPDMRGDYSDDEEW